MHLVRLNKRQRNTKRLFDLFFSLIGLIVLFAPLIIIIMLSTISTKKFGLYSQQRIGLYGMPFDIYKVRSMKQGDDSIAITLKNDQRITKFGHFLRRYKLDEIPQLWNVLIGDMSLVGPRPDIPGYADQLKGDDRIVLSVRPGITGPATIKYKNEETLLASQSDPIQFNDTVIWKDKIKINKQYIRNWSFRGDLMYILKTIFS